MRTFTITIYSHFASGESFVRFIGDQLATFWAEKIFRDRAMMNENFLFGIKKTRAHNLIEHVNTHLVSISFFFLETLMARKSPEKIRKTTLWTRKMFECHEQSAFCFLLYVYYFVLWHLLFILNTANQISVKIGVLYLLFISLKYRVSHSKGE